MYITWECLLLLTTRRHLNWTCLTLFLSILLSSLFFTILTMAKLYSTLIVSSHTNFVASTLLHWFHISKKLSCQHCLSPVITDYLNMLLPFFLGGPNPCAGDPCPSDTACFYSREQFLCLPQNTRKRRDLLSDDGKSSTAVEWYFFILQSYVSTYRMQILLFIHNIVACPCQNNGTCHHSEDGEVNYCKCAKGFSGILCETGMNWYL